MNTTAESSFVVRRAELLAELVLTRRRDVEVVRFDEASDLGVDMLARLPPLKSTGSEKAVEPYLCIQVKGTTEPLESETAASAYAARHWKALSAKRGFFLAPIACFVFSMEGDRGYWGWMMEPVLKGKGAPGLAWVDEPQLAQLTRKSVDVMLDATEEWFELITDLVVQRQGAK
jgi:hypothetical protein